MREGSGLTQQELADRLGLTEDQITALESGEISAGPPLRPILMRYFDCEFEQLFEVLQVNPER